ncbi:peptidyl-prolyl cis-trans isomerase [Tannerella sp.]|uniref:peptidyl-prolyl cis-trans isomerase n=1 Tax=Tannerella sp. TaxID=2382127 RepID=UPI0026DAAAEB|nr:peptidyl-prolyl cis-trans isomerase [Tannerella sp.]MDO4703722.1 peptidyl-prolyl cis-trans isomerase [Tannerella sp.]
MKRKMWYLWCVLAGGYILGACRPSGAREDADILVQVEGLSLTRSEVEKVIPQGSTPADSLLMAENYIKKWITDILIYEVAEDNLGREEAEVNRLVEEYRRALLRHRYLEGMVHNKLSAEIQESEKRQYYDENTQKFTLDKHLIKGLFIKVPFDAPGLEDVRKWYKSEKLEAVENIEKYSIQNASMYDYFYDHWVDLDEALAKIPTRISNKTQFLKTNKAFEFTDSTYCYFLNISEYLLAGNVAPYEYAQPQIEEVMINKRKVEFLRNFEEELYRDAVRKGSVIFYNMKP